MDAQDLVQEVFVRLFRAQKLVSLAGLSAEVQAAHLLKTLGWVMAAFHRHHQARRRIHPEQLVPLPLLMESGWDLADPVQPVGRFEQKWLGAILEECLQKVAADVPSELWQKMEAMLWMESVEPFLGPVSSRERTRLSRIRSRLRTLVSAELAREDP